MNIKESLENLYTYFHSTHRIGHTTAMIEGAKNVDSVVILARSAVHVRELKKLAPKANFVHLENTDALRGMNKPLVIDNFTMTTLLSESLCRINDLEREIDALKREIDRLNAKE